MSAEKAEAIAYRALWLVNGLMLAGILIFLAVYYFAR
jgi:hypothetical protein